MPFAIFEVFHETLYEEAVSSEPAFVPLYLNWTPETPVSSDAVAVRLTTPVRLLLFTGYVSVIVGTVVSAGVPPSLLPPPPPPPPPVVVVVFVSFVDATTFPVPVVWFSSDDDGSVKDSLAFIVKL